MMIAKMKSSCQIRRPVTFEIRSGLGSRHLAAVKRGTLSFPLGFRCSVLGAAVVWCEKKKMAFWALLLILLFS